jgi:hypothetical protein
MGEWLPPRGDADNRPRRTDGRNLHPHCIPGYGRSRFRTWDPCRVKRGTWAFPVTPDLWPLS